MILGKKERRITIAIGLIIGVSVSSMLVKHAVDIKEDQAAKRPGSYGTLKSAGDMESFPALPKTITESIPNGIVIFYEANRTSLTQRNDSLIDAWIIETSGSFRSERLFILAEVETLNFTNTEFFRASEIYLQLGKDISRSSFEKKLDDKKFRVIGKNSFSGELIVQIRNFSPASLHATQRHFKSLPEVKSTRFSRWNPSR